MNPRKLNPRKPNPRKLTVFSFALVALAALFAACGGSSGGSSGSASSGASSGSTGAPASSRAGAPVIIIKNFAFHPATLTVAPGATVTVHNEDNATHTVTAVAPHDRIFNTGDVAPGATATFKAPSTPGTYPYICLIHQFMHGTLVVS